MRERSTLPEELKVLLAVLAPTTLPLSTESGEALTSYSPQRLMRQFGLDQGAVVVLGESCLDVWEAEDRFTQSGRDALLVEWDSVFWPSLSMEGALSPGGALYWLRCLEAFTQFVAPDSPNPTLLAPVVLIPARDPYLRGNKEFEGSTLQAAEARKQLEDISVPEAVHQPPASPQPSHSAKSTALRPSPVAKGKEVAAPSPKIQRKRKESWQRPPRSSQRRRNSCLLPCLQLQSSRYVYST